MIATQQQIDCGCECRVFDTENPDIVFKLYKTEYGDGYTKRQVQRIVQLNCKYAKRGLAPQVYSDIIKTEDGYYGYYVERVLPFLDDDKDNMLVELAVKLGIDYARRTELSHNWGLTKDKRPVLFDFGLLTLYVLGLIEDYPDENE